MFVSGCGKRVVGEMGGEVNIQSFVKSSVQGKASRFIESPAVQLSCLLWCIAFSHLAGIWTVLNLVPG